MKIPLRAPPDMAGKWVPISVGTGSTVEIARILVENGMGVREAKIRADYVRGFDGAFVPESAIDALKNLTSP